MGAGYWVLGTCFRFQVPGSRLPTANRLKLIIDYNIPAAGLIDNKFKYYIKL